MNTRFLLFVLSMTFVLFFVNQYFTSEKQKAQKQVAQEKHEMVEQEAVAHAKEVQARTLSPDRLPLYPLYNDGQGSELVAWALLSDTNTYLTVAWDSDLPSEVYTQDHKGVYREVHLNIEPKKKGSLALYSSSEKSSVTSTYLPQLGLQDVQLLTTTNPVNVVLGEYEEGHIYFPKDVPPSNAIVLYQLDGKYVPVGLYQVENDKFLPFSQLSNYQETITYKTPSIPASTLADENFYVLENEYIQLVFSTVGGALAEVNLPFQSKLNEESVVLPIDFDRIIDKSYTSNARFPNHSYHVVRGGTASVEQPTQGGYYPLLRRGIQKNSGYPAHTLDPRFYGFNTVSEDSDTAQLVYRVVSFDENSIRFEAKEKNRRIIKTYTLPKNEHEAPYCLFASIKVEGDSRGLWITSGVPEVELISGSAAPEIKYSAVQNQKSVVEKLSLPKTSTTLSSFQPDWISNSNGYFTLIYDPLDEIGAGFQANYVPGNVDPSRIVVIDSQNDLYPASKYPGYVVHMPLRKSSAPMEFRLFLGPLDHDILKQVDATFTNNVTGYNPRYTETQSFHGWLSFISEPFAKFLFLIMNFFYTLTHSWGFSIILLTVVLRLMMYPLNAWSIKSTLKLQEISPKLQKLQEKYKKDPKRAQMEMMQFYKQHKVNPFGGCLPLIIQMPFLFGMFNLLKSTFSLRGASFIPGWIDNLTAPDVLFSWSYPIPFIGTDFHLLPIILGVVMFFQQKFTVAQNKKKGPLTDQQKQQQKMGTMMTIVFTFLFYKFPSGLNIYWLSSMSLQILQQWYMSNRRKKLMENPREVVVEPKKSRAR